MKTGTSSRCADPVHDRRKTPTATVGRRRAEQAFDPQHVTAWTFQREPVAEQFRRAVGAARVGAIFLGVRPVGLAIEDEVRAEVNQGRAGRCCRPGQGEHAEGIDLECRRGILFGGVDAVVHGAVDDKFRAFRSDDVCHRAIVGDVELLPVQGNDVMAGAELADDGAAEQAAGAGDEDAHQAASASPSAATTACCCSAVSSP